MSLTRNSTNARHQTEETADRFLGIIGGLGAGFGLAFFVNFLDDSIKVRKISRPISSCLS